ncbi:MAG TPA: hypothetical protein VK168_21055 [Saprospiraceae bacterium]|nr:hypothetical protein [Saprospiraceae bacterium]
MQKIFFLLVLAVIWVSCQNTPKAASEPQTPAISNSAVPTPVSAAPEAIQNTLTSVSSAREAMLSMRQKIDGLPDKVKAKHKAEIDAMYNDLEGIIEKSGFMMSELQSGSAKQEGSASEDVAAPKVVDEATVNDFKSNMEAYNQYLKEMEEKIKAMGGGK